MARVPAPASARPIARPAPVRARPRPITMPTTTRALAPRAIRRPKAAVQVTKFTIAPANGTWTTILNTQIKTAPKTLMIDVSLNTELVTTTAITGTGSNSSTAGLLVRVLVDGNPAL